MIIRQQSADSDPSVERWRCLGHWYRQPPGQRFGALERDIVRDLLPSLFGYYLVALGEPLDHSLLSLSPVSRRWLVDASPFSQAAVDLRAMPEQLPLASDSVDVLVLSHVLECCADPVATLKEVDRVLISEGYAIILGFNPFSLWRVYFTLGGMRESHWNLFRSVQLCSVSRLRSWLALLGLETLSVIYHSHGLPVHNTSLGERWDFLQTLGQRYWRFAGGGYVLLVRKRVSTLTPIQPRWVMHRPVSTQGATSLYQGEAHSVSASPTSTSATRTTTEREFS